MPYFIYAFYVYLAISFGFSFWMVYTLWQEDLHSDRTRTTDKFGYNFRKFGRRDGKLWITTTAWIMIGITLPFINLITLAVMARTQYLENRLRS